MDKETVIRQMTELIVCSMNRPLIDSEQQMLDQWLEESAKNRALYERLCDSKYLAGHYKRYSDIDTRSAWSRVRDRRRRHFSIRIGIVAASVLLLFGGSMFGWRMNEMHYEKQQELHALEMLSAMPGTGKVTLILSDSTRVQLGDTTLNQVVESEGVVSGDKKTLAYKNEDKNGVAQTIWHTLVVDRGAEFSLTLSDGTIVHLNAGSSLRYPASFTTAERKVYLQGEGYFDVTPDKARMFVVDGGTFAVAVYGTSFNVSNYKEDRSHDVTLVNGRVSVTCNNNRYDLEPDRQLMMDAGSVTIRPVMAQNSIAWINDSFYFNSERLENILSELSRWYDLEIVFRGDSEKDYLFTGFVPKYAQIGQVLDVLKQTRGFDVEVKNDRIVVVGK